MTLPGSPQNADHADCRLQTADCRLQTADCRLQTADCRLQTVQTMQTAQTMQTEYFFLTLDSLISVLQLQNSVKYVVMFIIYPQTAHLTVVTSDC